MTGPWDALPRTVVLLPSLSLDPVELAKIPGIGAYEERLLCSILLLARPEQRLVYLTSAPVDPAIVDYHRSLLPGPVGDRLVLLDAGDDRTGVALTRKILDRPALVDRVRRATGDPAHACLVPFNVTEDEQVLADALGLPLFGARPELVALGTKSGSRRTARRAGVAVPTGAEDLYDLGAVQAAVDAVAAGVVVKLNGSFAGQGNALLPTPQPGVVLSARATTFCADGEGWATFGPKLVAEGGIVEALLDDPALESPSTQVAVLGGGRVEVLSTHDQVLVGPGRQVYDGCRYPAAPKYRRAIETTGRRIGEVLAEAGVVGPFAVDWLVPAPGEVLLSEINLRLGGTTHPFWMARLVTGATPGADGQLRRPGGTPVAYRSTDGCKGPALLGRTPADVIAELRGRGLLYDPAVPTAEGATLHLLGALATVGKLGFTCIAATRERADRLDREVRTALGVAPSAG